MLPDDVKARRAELARRLRLGDHLAKSYGLTLAQYDAMVVRQGGKCAACEYPPKPGHRLHVDHDHSTGKVRGLLCHGCNVALGLMDENPLLIQQLAHYAEFCVQRREAVTQKREPWVTEPPVFQPDPTTPHVTLALREALQRLYAKPTTIVRPEKVTPKPTFRPLSEPPGKALAVFHRADGAVSTDGVNWRGGNS